MTVYSSKEKGTFTKKPLKPNRSNKIAKIKNTLYDFFCNYRERRQVYCVKDLKITIKTRYTFDLYPIHFLPYFSFYRGDTNRGISFGWLLFGIRIDIYTE